MATFSYQTSGQSTLELQLQDKDGAEPFDIALVRQVLAASETSSGSAYHPQISRPSSFGTPSSSTHGRSFGPTSQGVSALESKFSVATAWTVHPSLPTLSDLVANLPFIMELVLPQGSEIVVVSTSNSTPTESLLLYSTSSGGHTWSGGFIWEEPY